MAQRMERQLLLSSFPVSGAFASPCIACPISWGIRKSCTKQEQMLLFILLRQVETAANPPPAHWVGQTHKYLLNGIPRLYFRVLAQLWLGFA